MVSSTYIDFCSDSFLSVCLSDCLHLSVLPFYLFACLSVCLPVCLSACLSVCLPACLFVCMLDYCLPTCLTERPRAKPLDHRSNAVVSLYHGAQKEEK